jgi:hypothetical protein
MLNQQLNELVLQISEADRRVRLLQMLRIIVAGCFMFVISQIMWICVNVFLRSTKFRLDSLLPGPLCRFWQGKLL